MDKAQLTASEEIETIRREVEILHHLGGHPAIVTCKGVFEDATPVYVVLEVRWEGGRGPGEAGEEALHAPDGGPGWGKGVWGERVCSGAMR